MSVEASIYSMIVADAAVSAIIGNRAYPVTVPRAAQIPFLIYYRTSTEPQNVLSGRAASEFATIKVECCAASYQVAKLLADAVKNVIGAYTETTPAGTKSCMYDDEADDYIDPINAEDDGVYRVTQDYFICYTVRSQ